jgi:hypothetical protein
MEEAFEQLDELIIITIAPGAIGRLSITGEQLSSYQYTIIAASEALRKCIISWATHPTNENDLRVFMFNCQSTLVDLLDKLFIYQQAEAGTALNSLYQKAEEALERVFYTIKDRYCMFFNHDGRMPLKGQRHYGDNLDETLPVLKQRLKTQLPNTVLLDIAFAPLRLFQRRIEQGANTWQLLAYTKELAARLECWPGGRFDKDDAEWHFIKLLLEMNVNDPAAYDFCLAFVQDGIRQTADIDKKIEWLDDYSRRLQYAVARAGTCFNPGMMPLKEYMQLIVREESDAAEKAWLAIQRKNNGGQKGFVWPGQKIISALGGALEGVWIRAEHFAGKIKGDNLEEMIDTWMTVVESKGKAFSAKSIRGKSRPSLKIHDWEKVLLLGMLKRMIQYVEGL